MTVDSQLFFTIGASGLSESICTTLTPFLSRNTLAGFLADNSVTSVFKVAWEFSRHLSSFKAFKEDVLWKRHCQFGFYLSEEMD
jgi:hypothetical protein